MDGRSGCRGIDTRPRLAIGKGERTPLNKITLSVPIGRRPIDPTDVFGRLILRGSVKNIWEPQADALKQWHKVRSNSEVMVRLNAGGGKTLVGLLMAQSLANESRGQILYVCPNNQLV